MICHKNDHEWKNVASWKNTVDNTQQVIIIKNMPKWFKRFQINFCAEQLKDTLDVFAVIYRLL